MKNIKGILAFAFVLVLCLTGCSKNADYVLTTGFAKGELCKVDDMSCVDYEAMIYLTNIVNEYRNIYGTEFVSGEDDVVERLRQQSFSKLLKVKVMNLMAKEYKVDIDSEDEELIRTMSDEFYNSLNDEEKKNLKNVSYSEIQNMYREYMLALKTYKYIVKDVNLEISDDEARTVVVKRIYLSTKDTGGLDVGDEEKERIHETAKSIYNRLLAGEDFDVLSMECSGGSDATISYNKGELDTVLEQKVFELSEGQTSELIAGNDGYYIFYCVNPFSRVDTDANKARIIQERQKETFENVFEAYADDVTYYLNSEAFDEIKYDDSLTIDSFFKIYNKYNPGY